MAIINLTSSAIRVGDRVFLPSGDVAKAPTSRIKGGSHDGIPLTYPCHDVGTGLPDAEDGVLFLTSAQVRLAVPHRMDVASPGQIVTDNQFWVISCSSLDVNAS
jgi:hypothetical protein